MYIDLLWGCPQRCQDLSESIFTSLGPSPLGYTQVCPLCALRHFLWPALNSETRVLKWIVVSSTALWLGHSNRNDSIICWLVVCIVSFSPKLWPWPHWDEQLLITLQTKQRWGQSFLHFHTDKWMSCVFPLHCYENQCPAHLLIIATLEAI